MFATVFLAVAALFADSKTLAVQIRLDQAGFSCNQIDGQWGRKSEAAALKYLECKRPLVLGHDYGSLASEPELMFDLFFRSRKGLFTSVAVTRNDLATLVRIPSEPAQKAALPTMGYESLREMFAERGHLSVRALERLNPGVDWDHVTVGQRILLPSFPSIAEELTVWPKGAGRRNAPVRPEATLVKVSLSRYEISAYDEKGRVLALFPCSIARDKAKVPRGEMKVTGRIPNPNYTYTPDIAGAGGRVARHIYPPGPNCPVGVAWLGLNLSGYGIHGTPNPVSIGCAESHGCFRLANWNAARLYGLCRLGARVVVER